jgi:hypothetical protein
MNRHGFPTSHYFVMKTKSKLLTIIPKPVPKMTAEPLSKYQAHGIIAGKVMAVGDFFRVQIGSHEHKLVVDKQKKRGFRTLIEQSDEPIVMKVCPTQSKPNDLRFILFKALTERPAENEIDRLILRGIWQYLEFSEDPVFSILALDRVSLVNWGKVPLTYPLPQHH